MKRTSNPKLSSSGEDALTTYREHISQNQDLSISSRRNYMLDMRHFILWSEQTGQEGMEEAASFSPESITTPLVVQYRSYLQSVLLLKPASINRILVSLKRYCKWAVREQVIVRDPADTVKFIPLSEPTPRHLSDKEENELIAAVENNDNLRDRTIIILLLHTGLRAMELCSLRKHQVHIQTRTGWLDIYGKRNKHRDVPLNSTAREALEEYLSSLPEGADYLFAGDSERAYITTRTLQRIVARYAENAKIAHLHPHDLRHRFGYRLAETGVPEHRIAQIMGHDSLDTTMLYTRGTQSDIQKEVEKVAWK